MAARIELVKHGDTVEFPIGGSAVNLDVLRNGLGQLMLRFRSASKPSVFMVEGQRPKAVPPKIQRSGGWTALVENCRQGANVTLGIGWDRTIVRIAKDDGERAQISFVSLASVS
jgi:hypothetical protein